MPKSENYSYTTILTTTAIEELYGVPLFYVDIKQVRSPITQPVPAIPNLDEHVGWHWVPFDDEEAVGPFNTKEEAIKSIPEHMKS